MSFVHLSTLSLTVLLFLGAATGTGLAGSEPAHAQPVEVFAEIAQMSALDKERFDDLGSSIALDGTLLAAGAPGEDENGSSAGAVYLFEHDGEGVWSQVLKLIASDGGQFDLFGESVALEGDTLIVGATGDDDAANDAGAIYTFSREADGSWFEADKLHAPDAATNERFGISLALQGDRLAVGTDLGDAAYVFERNLEGVWQPTAKLIAPDGPAEGLGYSVSLDEDRLVAGAPRDLVNDQATGSVYIFELEAEAWRAKAKLASLEAHENAWFGNTVSLSGDRLAVGAYLEEAIYVFERSESGTWQQTFREEQITFTTQQFGYAVALEGDRLAVSDPKEANLAGGAVFIYERDQKGNWSEIHELEQEEGFPGDRFGSALSLEGEVLAIGARLDGFGGNLVDTGGAWVFELRSVEPQIDIQGECPGEVAFGTLGVTPIDHFGLYFSDELGTSELDVGPCAGTQMELADPQSIRLWPTDYDGIGVLYRLVDESRCGQYIQIVDATTCLPSGAGQIPQANR